MGYEWEDWDGKGGLSKSQVSSDDERKHGAVAALQVTCCSTQCPDEGLDGGVTAASTLLSCQHRHLKESPLQV